MPYARINMAEFTSSAEAERTIAILRNDIKSVFPKFVRLPVSKPQKHRRLRFPSMTMKKLLIELLYNGINTTKIKTWQIYLHMKVT